MKKILFLLVMINITITGCKQNTNNTENKKQDWTLESEARHNMIEAFKDESKRTDLIFNESSIVFQSGDSVIVISQMISYNSDKKQKRESYEYIYFKPTNCDSLSYGYINDISKSGGTTMQILDYDINRLNKFLIENGGKEVDFDFIAPKRLATVAITQGKELKINKAEH